MRVIWNNTNECFQAEFDPGPAWKSDLAAAKSAGFVTDGAPDWLWCTNSTSVLTKLKLITGGFAITQEALEHFNRLQHIEQTALSDSRAVDAKLEIPTPNNLSFLPYQRAGIQYAAARKNCLLADEPGLGKTPQSIGVSNVDWSIQNVLVICPATPKLNWQREWRRWDTKMMTVGVTDKTFPNTDVVITNFDVVKKFRPEIDKRNWDLLIIDEIHKLKNPKALRTVYILGRKKRKEITAIAPIKADRKLFLTGTPILNRPSELWTVVHALDPNGVGANHWTFLQRYCGATQLDFGWDFSGASNLDELQTRLRSSIMIRRLKKDVLKELPAKRRQIIEIPVNKAGMKLIDAERKAYGERLQGASDMIKSNLFAEQAKLAEFKIPYILEHIEDMLEETPKLVVMAAHHSIIDAITDKFGPICVKLDGRDNEKKKQEAVDRFQTDPNTRLFVGSIQAAGVAITLTAADTMVFVEEDWVAANITQAEDRIHRIGQTESVLIQHLVLQNSLDCDMINEVIAKQEIADKALD